MTEQYIAIPCAVFMDRGYGALGAGDKGRLLELYREFGDCQSFTIDFKQDRAQSLYQLVRTLIAAGLIEAENIRAEASARGKPPRIFRFKYRADMAYE